MILIINTNRIIAALIKNSVSRQILLSPKFNFLSPHFSEQEIEKHKKEILQKADISENEFKQLLELFLRKITVIEDSKIADNMTRAKNIMDLTDKSDTPFIAAALSNNCGIWSDYEHLQKQTKIKIWKTSDLVDYFNRT